MQPIVALGEYRRMIGPLRLRDRDLIGRIKRTDVTVPAGADLVREGDLSRNLYTISDGWAARYHRHRARGTGGAQTDDIGPRRNVSVRYDTV